MHIARLFAGWLVLLTTSSIAWAGTDASETAMDWQCWLDLPVQNGGRQKPLDTLARETLRQTSNRAYVVDSETGHHLTPTELYLTLLFEWTGWDHERNDSLLLSTDWASQYFYFHLADRWDKTPLLRVDHPALQQMLGLPERARYVAPAILTTTSIVDPRTQQSVPFAAWGRMLSELQDAGKPLSQVEEKGLELAHRLEVYQNERMGVGLEILPSGKADSDTWMPVGQLMLTEFDDSTDPDGQYRQVQHFLWEARSAFRRGDAGEFNRAAHELRTVLRTAGPALGTYPSEFEIGAEVAYNRWVPFRYAWILMLLATVAMLLHLGTDWRTSYRSVIALYLLALVALVVGFVMRAIISGRPPVTDMYESVIYVGAGVAVFGMVFEWIYRKKYVLTAAAAVSTVALILADNCPGVLDPSVRPLQPVLRSNFWLATHVMTITLSYAAFALALGIANISLGYYLVRSEKADTIGVLSQLTYRAIQIGVLLLAAGIILGGVWADYSWGRFWGWDPKEVWALVALLGYLAVLHARFGGAVGSRGLAALTVVCFTLVVMAWYGVNFVLGTGLHSYGFGGGGQGPVCTAILFQWLYAAIALRRSRPDASSAVSVADDRPSVAIYPWAADRAIEAPAPS